MDKEHEIQDMDIVIMYTDGVCDNLLDSKSLFVKFKDLIDEVKNLCILPYLEGTTLKDTKACAECIAHLAHSVYKYPRKSRVPFKYPEAAVEEAEE